MNRPWYTPFLSHKIFFSGLAPSAVYVSYLRQEDLNGLLRDIEGGSQLKKKITGNLESESQAVIYLLHFCWGCPSPQSFTSPGGARQGSETPLPTFIITQFVYWRLKFPVSYGKILIFFPLLKWQCDTKLKNNVNLHFLLLGELFAPNG